MSDQDACKATLTDFAISKGPCRMDELMFSSALKQKLASTAARIVSIDDLRKELSLACNHNTSSLRAHVQKIVSILQGIMSSTKSRLPIQREFIVLQNRAILPIDIETPNELALSTPLVDETSP